MGSRKQDKPERTLDSQEEALEEIAERSDLSVEELRALRAEMGLASDE